MQDQKPLQTEGMLKLRARKGEDSGKEKLSKSEQCTPRQLENPACNRNKDDTIKFRILESK